MNRRTTQRILQLTLFLGLLGTGVSWVRMSSQDAIAASEVRRTRFNPKVDQYTVRSGDTLWDISQNVVGSPWVWPKVWSYNPEIANPHWIYPGDVIYFYERDFDFPSLNARADLASREIEQEPVEDSEPEYDSTQLPGVEVVGKSVLRRQRAGRRVYTMLITEKQLQEAGTLVNAEDDDILLSIDDKVFFKFPSNALPAEGDDFMLYRTVQKVRHPIRDTPFGYITEVTGFARVLEARGDGIVSAVITAAEREIERGQLVTPKTSDLRMVIERKKAASAVNGVVVAVHSGWGVVGSEQQLAFIDVGALAGLERGNELVVYRRSDELRDTGRGNDLPLRPIGLLRVVDSKPLAATVLVVDSLEEIEPGQKVRAIAQ